MRKVRTIFLKQIKDTIKNKAVFIQFILFPLMAVIMENAIEIADMPEHFFVLLFSSMYVGMVPLTCISAIISEEKETGTLGMLRMSNVRAWEYFMGTGIYVFALCMAGGLVFACAGEYKGWRMGAFFLIFAGGVFISIFIGAIIGLMSSSQMGATSITVPVTMVFAFLPMLSIFNERIREIAKFVYSYEIQDALGKIGKMSGIKELVRESHPEVIAVHVLVVMIVFGVIYKRAKI